MDNFIEVHVHGRRRLLNIDYVAHITEASTGEAVIWYGIKTSGMEMVHFVTDETYNKVQSKIWR